MEASTACGCFPQAERIVSVAEVTRPCFRSESETPLAPHLLWRVALCPDRTAHSPHFQGAQTSKIARLSPAGVWGVLLA